MGRDVIDGETSRSRLR